MRHVSRIKRKVLRRQEDATCRNGCPSPVAPPSRVLCAACNARLDAKFRALAEAFRKVTP